MSAVGPLYLGSPEKVEHSGISVDDDDDDHQLLACSVQRYSYLSTFGSQQMHIFDKLIK